MTKLFQMMAYYENKIIELHKDVAKEKYISATSISRIEELRNQAVRDIGRAFLELVESECRRMLHVDKTPEELFLMHRMAKHD